MAELNESLNLRGLLSLWGKTSSDKIKSPDDFYPVLFHMADVMVVCQELANTLTFGTIFEKLWSNFRISSEDNENQEIKSLTWFLFAMHDFGKISPHFQNRGGTIIIDVLERHGIPVKKFVLEKSNHPGLSKKLFDALAKEYKIPRRIKSIFRKVILGHHGRFDDSNSSEHEQISTEWFPIRKKVWDLFIELTGAHPELWKNLIIDQASLVGITLQSILVLSDWLASNNELFKWQEMNQIPENGDLRDIMRQHLEISRFHANEVLDKMGFNDQFRYNIPDVERISLETLFSHYNFQKLFPIQTLSNELTGNEKVVIIEAPMGEGKTEAAITIASKLIQQQSCAGFYFALPTMATSNQMFGRVLDFLKQYNPVYQHTTNLVHGRSWVVDKFSMIDPNTFGTLDPEQQKLWKEYLDAFKWFEPKRRALLSPFAVGTVDQALMAVLNVKFGFLRLLGLSNKILIIDEAHAYDAYMMEIFDRLLEWAAILDIPVIILSATLPKNKKSHIFNQYLHAKRKYGVNLPNLPNLPNPPNPPNNQEYNNHAVQIDQLPRLTIQETPTDIDVEPYPMISTLIEYEEDPKLIYQSNEEPQTQAPNQKTYEIHNIIGTEGNTSLMASIIINNIYQIIHKQSEKEGENASDFGCHCVILNTVKAAQELYEKLNQIFNHDSPLKEDWVPNDVQVLLFHSRYTVEDREEIEKNIEDLFGKKGHRPKNAILVATQVVEQSLDLDFDFMYTEIAPIDLIVQRMGRVWRHSRDYRPTSQLYPNPTVFVFSADFFGESNDSVSPKVIPYLYTEKSTKSGSWLNEISNLAEQEKSSAGNNSDIQIGASKNTFNFVGNSKIIYSPYLLTRTQILLDSFVLKEQITNKAMGNPSVMEKIQFTVEFPRDLRELIERVYQYEMTFPSISAISKNLSESTIPAYLSSSQEELQELHKKHYEKEKESSRKTLNYLIPPPERDSYRYAETYQKAFEEGDENEGNSYFMARTRWIQDTCSLILLEEGSELHAKYLEYLDNPKKKPSKAVKEKFLKKSVSTRFSYIKEAIPAENYTKIQAAPDWMHGFYVITLKHDPTTLSKSMIWEGTNSQSENIRFKYSTNIGLLYEKQTIM